MRSRSTTTSPARLEALPAATRISAAYERYLRSLIPITDEQIRAALFEQLDAGELIKGPFLEATPAYLRGRSVTQLIAAGCLPAEFAELGSEALPLDRPLYLHQEQALLKALAGRNLVVATGTGSGKTESFLLPILAELASQHAQGRLGAGVRALLLYPMNALANDQVKRLRATLAATPWITFGRYTGETKEKAKDAGLLYEDQFPGQPRLPNELLSREEMRANPPHLLLTNYAMLEYLLLRPQDLDLFDPKVDSWRFIVVDEAHVYDGARGTEVAMLLRRLKDRVASRRVQVIATSATVGSDSAADQVVQFARNLFDAPFEWNPEDPARQDIVQATRVTPPAGRWDAGPGISFAEIARAPRAGDTAPQDPQCADVTIDDPWLAEAATVHSDPTAAESAEALIQRAAGDHAMETAARTLAAERHVEKLREALLGGPQDVGHLATCLFGNRSEALTELAGLVDLAAGLRDDEGNPIISARYHLWVNSTDAAYVCLRPGHHHGYLRERSSCDRCDEAGHRGVPVWQFAACQRCSTGYIYGRSKESGLASSSWLALGHPQAAVDEDEEATEGSNQAGDAGAWLCPVCGTLGSTDADCLKCASPTRPVTVVTAPAALNPNGRKDTPPRRCIACGGYSKGLIRGLGAGPEASTSVLATSAYQELPGDDPEIAGEARKLLAFSDSRQQAAYFAPYLQGGYQKFLWRRILLEAVIGACTTNSGQPVPFDDVLARGVTLAAEHHLLSGRSGISARREVASWLIAELSGTDERNSLEGTGLLQVRVDRGTTSVPRPLRDLGLTEDEAWTLVEELLATVRRAGAIERPAGLDVDLGHEAFGPRKPDWGVCETDPDPRRHIAAWAPQRGTNKRQSYIERVLVAKGADPASAATVLAGLWNWLTKVSGTLVSDRNRASRVIHRQALSRIVFAPGGAGQVQCDRCRRWATGTVGGVCPTLNCSGTVAPAVLPDAASDDDHYRTLYRTLEPAAMTAVEHTAQWTSLEAADIQRRFISGVANVLSCSTTFELGVDVGELQSVLLRNVPPTTANYVQRAGRAGRRGAAAALVVTFARSRPHDQAMFRDPLAMIAGEMRAPYVPTDNERITRRHVHSIALSAFFRNAYATSGLTWRTMDSFFSAEISPSGPNLLAGYLETVPAEVRQSAAAVVVPELDCELGLSDGTWKATLVRQVYELRDEYRGERQVLVAARAQAVEESKFAQASMYDSTIKTLDSRLLLDRLATKNILPKYGFPVDVVELKTYHLDGAGRKLELSRDLAVAIAEYAPGGQIVAGGRVIRSGGLAKQAGKAWVAYRSGTCKGEDRHFVMRLEAEDFPATCPDCDAPIQGVKALRPEFGFVADKRSESIADEPPRGTPVEAAKVLRLSSEPHARVLRSQSGPINLKWGKRAEFAVVAHGPMGKGWWICAWCGRGVPAEGAAPPKKHDHPLTGNDCAGTLTRSRLVHTFETDALAIHLPSLGLVDREAVLAALLAGASDALELPMTDIGGTVYPTGSSTHLVIYDTVPGGAGNAIRIAQSFEDVVEHALARVQDCSCGLDTSCYACLRHYGNQRVHDRLTRLSALNGLKGLQVVDFQGKSGSARRRS